MAERMTELAEHDEQTTDDQMPEHCEFEIKTRHIPAVRACTPRSTA